MLPRISAAACCAAALLCTSPAGALGGLTVYDNAQSIPIGSRAAGMGGAYTALACDEGALHYNPASLSCASSSHLELSANAYVLQGMRASGALGPGANVSATTYHSVPSIVGAVHVLSEGSARTYFDTYPKRLTFGFTVSVPRSIALKVDPPKPDERNYASESIREDVTVGDLGLGYQLTKQLSVGLAVGAVLRTSERHSGWLLVRERGTPCSGGACNDFLSYSDERSSLAVDGHVKLGLLLRPVAHISLGLALTAPSFNLFGSAKESSTLTRSDAAGYAALPMRASGSSEVGLPGRAAVGFAYVKRRFTFSGDLSLNLPRDVRLAFDMVGQPIGGLAAPAAVPDRVISPGLQPNMNLGASVAFGSAQELDIGFFTDLSSVSQADIQRNSMSRVHMFGGSMTLGLLGKQSRVWIGASAEIGHTKMRVPGRSFTYENVIPLPVGRLAEDNDATLVRWTATGILGSNYSFLE